MSRKLYRAIVKLLLNLHGRLYRLIGVFAIKAEGGLHPKHRLMRYHDFFVDRVTGNDTVLDIGCGNGALAFDLAKKAKRVVAIDTNAKNRTSWEGQYKAANIEYLVADATSYHPTATFDIIVLSNVLEHIEHRVDFLKSIKEFAPALLIRVPMSDRDWLTPYRQELGLESRLDDTHCTEYTLDSFRNELTEAGLTIREYSVQFGEIWSVVKPAQR